MTSGVYELPDCVKAEALIQVAKFSEFSADNDPHDEHDFGSFNLVGRKFFWKIDYYDKDLVTVLKIPATRHERRVCSRSCLQQSTRSHLSWTVLVHTLASMRGFFLVLFLGNRLAKQVASGWREGLLHNSVKQYNFRGF